ncbi:hypothetical protein ACTI_33060 [Actinoplanes sp. OR16]|nr:hypothetical protein ACTI_33060 [Actinoplanes sp. OR16]
MVATPGGGEGRTTLPAPARGGLRFPACFPLPLAVRSTGVHAVFAALQTRISGARCASTRASACEDPAADSVTVRPLGGHGAVVPAGNRGHGTLAVTPGEARDTSLGYGSGQGW